MPNNYMGGWLLVQGYGARLFFPFGQQFEKVARVDPPRNGEGLDLM